MQIEQLNVQPFDCIPWSATSELQQFWPHIGYAYKTLSHRDAKLCSEISVFFVTLGVLFSLWVRWVRKGVRGGAAVFSLTWSLKG